MRARPASGLHMSRAMVGTSPSTAPRSSVPARNDDLGALMCELGEVEWLGRRLRRRRRFARAMWTRLFGWVH